MHIPACLLILSQPRCGRGLSFFSLAPRRGERVGVRGAAPTQENRPGLRCRMVDMVLTTFDWVPETPRAIYVARATARPSFVKAHADQMAHFSAAD